MSRGRLGRGRGRGGVRSKTLPYTPLCSSPISQPPSLGNSNGPPQQPVVQDEELQHEIPTGPSQQQGTTGSANVDSSAIIPQGRDPTDGKTWIQPCGQSFVPSVQPVKVIKKRYKTVAAAPPKQRISATAAVFSAAALFLGGNSDVHAKNGNFEAKFNPKFKGTHWGFN
ncbi:uncharacterized protein G2W53_039738 [Senna tora]|uniref:Uncharacterized protein n=1 Tax=Senna tora TaxID=362788 RepID=A0A834W313_9FABA|nr:uncharacterized protein G2W53_039738 [Senna tora]